MPHMARSNAIFLAAGTLFVCSVFLGAQAPAAPQQTAPAPQGARRQDRLPAAAGRPAPKAAGRHSRPSASGVTATPPPTPGTDRVGDPADDAGAHLRRRCNAANAHRTDGRSATFRSSASASSWAGGRMGSVDAGEAKSMPNQCTANPPMTDPAGGPAWNGWGNDLANTRFQPAAAARLTAADVPRLKLKWAFGIPNGMTNNAQPTVVSGRVFMASDNGYIYSLDAKTGCVYWSFQNGSIVRNSPMVGAVTGQGAARWAVFFGDGHANVFALDAQTGRQLWKVRVDDHVVARITAGVKYHDGPRLRAALGLRGVQRGQKDYPCCTGARRRCRARREHGQADLEDLQRRRAEAVEEEPERRAAVRALGRRHLGRADDRYRCAARSTSAPATPSRRRSRRSPTPSWRWISRPARCSGRGARRKTTCSWAAAAGPTGASSARARWVPTTTSAIRRSW